MNCSSLQQRVKGLWDLLGGKEVQTAGAAP